MVTLERERESRVEQYGSHTLYYRTSMQCMPNYRSEQGSHMYLRKSTVGIRCRADWYRDRLLDISHMCPGGDFFFFFFGHSFFPHLHDNMYLAP